MHTMEMKRRKKAQRKKITEFVFLEADSRLKDCYTARLSGLMTRASVRCQTVVSKGRTMKVHLNFGENLIKYERQELSHLPCVSGPMGSSKILGASRYLPRGKQHKTGALRTPEPHSL